MVEETPTDWRFPQWSKHQKVHGWRNYISREVRLLWGTLSDEAKQALARQANEQASNEEWD